MPPAHSVCREHVLPKKRRDQIVAPKTPVLSSNLSFCKYPTLNLGLQVLTVLRDSYFSCPHHHPKAFPRDRVSVGPRPIPTLDA